MHMEGCVRSHVCRWVASALPGAFCDVRAVLLVVGWLSNKDRGGLPIRKIVIGAAGQIDGLLSKCSERAFFPQFSSFFWVCVGRHRGLGVMCIQWGHLSNTRPGKFFLHVEHPRPPPPRGIVAVLVLDGWCGNGLGNVVRKISYRSEWFGMGPN
jgi:hypothetical protein